MPLHPNGDAHARASPAPDPSIAPSRRASPRAGPFLALLALTALAPASLAGQDGGIGDEIRVLGADNGRRYARPGSSGGGAGLSAGWFHTARSLGPLSFAVGVRAVGAFVPPEDESYRPILPSEVTIDALDGRTFREPYGSGEGVEAPTAVGDGASLAVEPQGEFREALLDEGLSPSDFALRFPRGFDLPAVPVGALQLNVGVAPGVDVAGRWVPEIELDPDVGSVQSVGGGLKLSVTDWIPGATPVDVAVSGGVQSLDVGDYLSADSRHVSLLVSRKLAGLTLFASGGLEDADAEIEYTLADDGASGDSRTVSFEDDGANSSRLTAGFSLDLLFLQLTADYSVAEYETVSAGLGVTF